MVQQLIPAIPFVDVNYKQLPFQFYNNRYLPIAESIDEKDVKETSKDQEYEDYEDVKEG